MQIVLCKDNAKRRNKRTYLVFVPVLYLNVVFLRYSLFLFFLSSKEKIIFFILPVYNLAIYM